MCLNETYSKVCKGKNLCDAFSTQNGRKQDVLSPVLFNFTLENEIRMVKENEEGFELHGKNQLLVYMDDSKISEKNINA